MTAPSRSCASTRSSMPARRTSASSRTTRSSTPYFWNVPSGSRHWAAAPTTVTRSRWPRTLTRRTQKPLSGEWKVTRSTEPWRCSGARSKAVGCCRDIRIWAFVVKMRPSLCLPTVHVRTSDFPCRSHSDRRCHRIQPPDREHSGAYDASLSDTTRPGTREGR